MNFAWYAFARALAVVVVAFVLMAIQSIGVALHERRGKPALERLGSAVSDGGRYGVDLWYWPPQLRLSGTYRGIPFHYESVNRNYRHILVDCAPVDAFETSIHRPSRLPSGISYARLNEQFPHWVSFFASRTPVPWGKRSLDRRPLGLGSGPGIDLYRQSGEAYGAEMLHADLEGLVSFCS